MEELGISAVASTIKNVLSNHTSSGKAKKPVNKFSRGEDSDYRPKNEEGVEGGGTYLDEEVLSITHPTSKLPRTKKPGIKKKLSTKNNMPPDAPTTRARRNQRPPTKGVMLDRMIGAMGRRLSIVVREGMKRLEKPVQAAKLASEAGVIIRAKWTQPVAKWSNAKSKAISEKNKLNRARVRHHQAMGSHCYISHLYTYLLLYFSYQIPREKNKERQVDIIELFKECHNSKIKGLSDVVQDAIDSMENIMAEPVGIDDTPRSSTKVVSKVLSQTSTNNTFLKNAGLETSCSKAPASTKRELREQLVVEKQGSAVLQGELHALKKKSEETEQGLAQTKDKMAKTQKEPEEFKKK
uniref:Uncharacterized protein n=1 Tax=Oryza punctata TaxID=4537 RepID=A0A0E0LBP2_ORYPU